MTEQNNRDSETVTLDTTTTLELYREAFISMKQKINDLKEIINEYGQDRLLDPSLRSVLIQAQTALEDCVGRTAKDENYRRAALANLIRYMK